MYKLFTFLSILGLSSLAAACDCNCDCDCKPDLLPPPAEQVAVMPLIEISQKATVDEQKKQEQEVISAKVLSTHETEATLKEIKDQPCRFRTALCPDRCGHATKVAIFQINKYNKYQENGEYGDPKQEFFYLDLNQTPFDQAPTILETLKTLKKGDKVTLNWDHYYVTQGGSSFPTRPVKVLEKITESSTWNLSSKNSSR